MTVGLASGTANSYLGVYRNTAYSAIATVYVQLHTGDPGASGTSNVSALTTRNAITWNAPSGGSMTLNTLSSFSMTASETITHIALFTASSAGTFLQSAALTGSVPVINGSTLTFSSCTVSFTPIAA